MLGQRRRRWANIKTALYQLHIRYSLTGRLTNCEIKNENVKNRHIVSDSLYASFLGTIYSLIWKNPRIFVAYFRKKLPKNTEKYYLF